MLRAKHSLPPLGGKLRKRQRTPSPPPPPPLPPLLRRRTTPNIEPALPPLDEKVRKRLRSLSPPSVDPLEDNMPQVEHSQPRRGGSSKKRRRSKSPQSPPPLSRMPSSKYRPGNVDVPDAVLPRRYKRHAVLLDDLDFDELKSYSFDSSRSSSSSRSSKSSTSLRPSSEFPRRDGQTSYAGSRTPRFYLESIRNLISRFLRRTKHDNRRSYANKRRGFLASMIRDWMNKRRKKRWTEAGRDNKEDIRIFYPLFELIDQRYRGGRLYYREESINSYAYHRVKFKHIWRTASVLDLDLYLAAKEMQYELEFEDAARNDDRFLELFRLIERKYGNARVMYKIDRFGRRHVKVEHSICGFRVCDSTVQNAIDRLCHLYQYEIGVRQDRKLKRWRNIFDAIELYFPDSKLFYKQITNGIWHAVVMHEVDGDIASGSSYTLDYALKQLSNELVDAVEDLQKNHRAELLSNLRMRNDDGQLTFAS
ncbi:uncharacterized protein FOMMEDRAFT_161259 [Fomitiporia mediterranea MF3/22]|uniref:uncharacterized protein n=1 Tax=Fomitiporia mediterranea (strain MF3/22) TaxID=694068 RepID=UPI0004407C61|nr:uncharacterized protein FOMMEDRAFT_161259 [Fomitiporia mediterranea MF3/22]EJC99039.1 hypothetical protein FOMMEDRAFT_161259 [Fomitiporia mediterranea MF3/22]